MADCDGSAGIAGQEGSGNALDVALLPETCLDAPGSWQEALATLPDVIRVWLVPSGLPLEIFTSPKCRTTGSKPNPRKLLAAHDPASPWALCLHDGAWVRVDKSKLVKLEHLRDLDRAEWARTNASLLRGAGVRPWCWPAPLGQSVGRFDWAH